MKNHNMHGTGNRWKPKTEVLMIIDKVYKAQVKKSLTSFENGGRKKKQFICI